VVLVPVSLDYVRQLQPDCIAVFDLSEGLVSLLREAGFGLVIVEGQGVKKIVAVGRKSDLIGKARTWKHHYNPHLDFEPETAMTAGGWFAILAASRSR
jgi:hypothetical protein